MCKLLLILINLILAINVIATSQNAVTSGNKSKLNLTAECSDMQTVHCTLTHLEAPAFEDMLTLVNATSQTLKTLLIRDSNLYKLPADLFSFAPNLEMLFVHNASIQMLGGNDFARSHRLTHLQFQFNKLHHILRNTISHAYMLRELLLGQNDILVIEANAFSEMSLLVYLDLQGNNLRTLPDGLFGDLIALEYLDLSSNNLQQIDEHTFSGNIRLQTLLLSNNQFSVFASNALEHLPKMNLLDISDCGPMPAINTLYLHSVVTLQVTSSRLEHLRIADGAQFVHANDNAIKTLNVGEPSEMLELNLQNNHLESLDAIAPMLNLRHLDISYNKLTTLNIANATAGILPLVGITFLNLTGNLLQNLSEENFLAMRKLKTLDLRHNDLQSLDVGIFASLINLEKLYINGNMLSDQDYVRLSQQHPHLKELTVLYSDLEVHDIRKISATFRAKGIVVIQQSIWHTEQLPQHEILADWTCYHSLTLFVSIALVLILLLALFYLWQSDRCVNWRLARSIGVSKRFSSSFPRTPLNEEDSV